MTSDHQDTSDRRRLSLSVVRDTCIVATLVVLGLYAGAAFLIPLTMALLVNVLIIALSDRVIAVTRAPVWIANIAGITVVLVGLFMIMYVLGSQATQFARSINTYESQFDGAVERITGLVGNDVTTFIRDNLVSIDMSYVRPYSAGQRNVAVEPVLSDQPLRRLPDGRAFGLSQKDPAGSRKSSDRGGIRLDARRDFFQPAALCRGEDLYQSDYGEHQLCRVSHSGPGICRDLGGSDFCTEFHPLNRVDHSRDFSRDDRIGAIRNHRPVSDYRSGVWDIAISDRQLPGPRHAGAVAEHVHLSGHSGPDVLDHSLGLDRCVS